MDFHENMKDVSIAMVSTSALLLTILAVVHIPYKVWAPVTALSAAGLYLAIGFGVLEFILLIMASDEEVSHETVVTHKLLWIVFAMEASVFFLGLFGIFVTVLAGALS